MKPAGSTKPPQQKAWLERWGAYLGIGLAVFNGLFQAGRNLATNAASLAALFNDRLAVGSLFVAALSPLLAGGATFGYGVMYRRSQLYAFAPERRSRRIAILRTGIVLLAIGVLAVIAFMIFWAIYR
ncbi:hypothetical protein [Micromonospora sp. NPDC005189]|uniref:hypothetical protein n=1 Tax=unclassified Micromonospora TaxID=2617518 RepID=UPI0033B6C6FE